MTQNQCEHKIAKLIVSTSNRGVKSFSVETIDKNYHVNIEYELREEINPVLEDFEKREYISLKRNKQNLITKIYINPQMVQEVAEAYKIQTKSDVAIKIEKILKKYEHSQFDEITDFVSNQRLALGLGKAVSFVDKENVKMLDVVLKGAEAMLSQDTDITLREFSIKVYNDSKEAEKQFSKIRKVLKRNSDEQITDILQEYHIYRNPVFALIKGNGTIHFKNGDRLTLLEDNGGIQLSMEYIRGIDSIDTKNVLSIENATSFTSHIVNRNDGLVLYLGGFSNNVNVELLKKTNCPVFHFGDIDANGFKILHNLSKRINKPVTAYKMGLGETTKYLAQGKQMDDFNSCELGRMTKQDIYSDEEKTIFSYLLENGITIEQEIIK